MTHQQLGFRFENDWPSEHMEYISQNYKTVKRVELLHKMFESYGIEKERLRLEFISAGEGNKFADTVIEMVQTLKELGPSTLNR